MCYVVIHLKRVAGVYRCPCGLEYSSYYDVRRQYVRDLNWGPWREVYLEIPRYRINCRRCGIKTEELDSVVRNCTYTRRLADAVGYACNEVRSIKAVAESFNLSWDTVKRIDSNRLSKELNEPDFSGVKYIAVDEFAVRKGHEYATVFLDIESGRVLWICKGRTQEAVENVFRNVFGEDVCKRILAVAMDCWSPYESAVKNCLPNAEIVWDMFHIIKNYNKDVIEKVRKQEMRNKLGKASSEEIKKSRFLVVKNPKNLREDEPAKLRQLLKINRNLCKVYIMADVLKKLWRYKYRKCARKWFMGWYDRAVNSRITPLKSFAKKLAKRIDGIIAHCNYPINTSILEGVNNKIKVIKRIAYGFRDEEYFFLKIRKHFSEIPNYPL